MRSLKVRPCLVVKEPAMSECDDQCSSAQQSWIIAHHMKIAERTPFRIALDALQADLPEILALEPSGGLSHISSLLEARPSQGGQEQTTSMMHAFIPVTMRSLLKVWLCLLCVTAVGNLCAVQMLLMLPAAMQS